MCVRTHVLFNSYLMYVNHFNIFFIPEVCSVTYTLLYIKEDYAVSLYREKIQRSRLCCLRRME